MRRDHIARGDLGLLSVAAGGGGAESYATTPGSNRLASVTTTAGLRSIAYDARGNTASEARPGGVSVTTAVGTATTLK